MANTERPQNNPEGFGDANNPSQRSSTGDEDTGANQKPGSPQSRSQPGSMSEDEGQQPAE